MRIWAVGSDVSEFGMVGILRLAGGVRKRGSSALHSSGEIWQIIKSV